MKNKISKEQAEFALLATLPNDIKILSTIFSLGGFDLYLVGGCIRDTFLGKMPKDYDVCTNAMPEAVIAMLEYHKIKYTVKGEHFAVVVAKMDEDYEIATFREDIHIEGNNRHPEVRLGVSIEDDCRRRDFTCNALFMDLQEKNIIDLVNGIEDIHNSIVKCVGEPRDRFNEDHLRKVRLIVRAIKDDAQIDYDTFDAVVNDPSLNISKERIFDELNKLNGIFDDSFKVYKLVSMLYESNLIDNILPGFILNKFDQINIYGVQSFITLFASAISKENTDVYNKLWALTFPTRLCSGIEMLLRDEYYERPLSFLSKRKSNDLTDNEFLTFFGNSNKIKFLVNFKIVDGLSADFMARGFQGKELGLKIDEFYLDQFKGAL